MMKNRHPKSLETPLPDPSYHRKKTKTIWRLGALSLLVGAISPSMKGSGFRLISPFLENSDVTCLTSKIKKAVKENKYFKSKIKKLEKQFDGKKIEKQISELKNQTIDLKDEFKKVTEQIANLKKENSELLEKQNSDLEKKLKNTIKTELKSSIELFTKRIQKFEETITKQVSDLKKENSSLKNELQETIKTELKSSIEPFTEKIQKFEQISKQIEKLNEQNKKFEETIKKKIDSFEQTITDPINNLKKENSSLKNELQETIKKTISEQLKQKNSPHFVEERQQLLK